MEAIEYLQQKKRMTKADKDGDCPIVCSDCPLSHRHNGTGYTCFQLERLNPERAIEIVEKWAKEHPLKTYAQDFFEKFPNAPRDRTGLPILCKKKIYGGECSSKCTNCWNLQMEET